jgi:hypothetical protein
MEGFLNITIPSPADVFWNCFRNSYDANPNGIDGKIRILSIIGESFIYKDMIDELEVKKNLYIFSCSFLYNKCISIVKKIYILY